jgi:hypothetical protein
MKDIKTLVPDIYELLKRKDGWFDETLSKDFSQEVSTRLHQQLGIQRTTNTLRLSQMGPRCPRALWFSIHRPELGEPLPPWAEFKYSFGHIIEALAVSLAKAAGHEVTGEQDELVLDGIVGHRDCVIDGCVVDVKSTSSRGFIKFKSPRFELVDSFGYLDQLDGYVVASADDPLVRCKDRGYILAIDKQLGHMVLYEHIIRERSIRERINSYKEIVGSLQPPTCECGTVPQGGSGNISLDVKASYEPFKYCCHPNLRTFLYSSGPVYLTKVVRKPDVPEVTKRGILVN